MRPRKPLVKPTPEQEALCKEYRTADTQDRKYKTDKYKTALSAAHREAYLIVQRYGAAVNHRKNMEARSSAEVVRRKGPSMGRPRLIQNPVTLTTTVEYDVAESLRREAFERRMSISAILRERASQRPDKTK